MNNKEVTLYTIYEEGDDSVGIFGLNEEHMSFDDIKNILTPFAEEDDWRDFFEDIHYMNAGEVLVLDGIYWSRAVSNM